MKFLETKHEKKSAIITTVLTVLLILMMLIFGFTYLDPPPENGIAINFGTSEVGSGQVANETPQTSPSKETPPPPPPESTTSKPEVNEETVTQETEEAPVIKEEKKEESKPKEDKKPEKKEEQPVETKETTKEPVKEVKKPDPKPDKSTSDAVNSLLNGPDQKGTENGGDGNDNKAGDKGDPVGDPNADSYYGQGKGTDGDGNYRLGGRKALNKEKFVQDCNESGTVVVKIEVNQNGAVINAVAGVKGTTNTNPCLLGPARKAALATKFNSDTDAPAKQVGVIIYEFKLSE